jgi:predicted ester cyclase
MKGILQMAHGDSHDATIHRFYEQCLNQHHSDILPELYTPGAILHTPNGDRMGLAAIQETVDGVHRMFPDHQFKVEDVIVSGHKAAARWSMTATHTAPIGGVAPTGRSITQNAIVLYRFEGDRIAEQWMQLDQAGVLRQIGVPILGAPANR